MNSDKSTFGFKLTSFTSVHSFRILGKDFRVVVQRKSYLEQHVTVSFYQELVLIGKEEKYLKINGPFGIRLKREKAMLFIFISTFAIAFAASFLTVKYF